MAVAAKDVDADDDVDVTADGHGNGGVAGAARRVKHDGGSGRSVGGVGGSGGSRGGMREGRSRVEAGYQPVGNLPQKPIFCFTKPPWTGGFVYLNIDNETQN